MLLIRYANSPSRSGNCLVNVAGTGCAATREACNECNLLTGSKFVLCHDIAFRARAYDLGRQGVYINKLGDIKDSTPTSRSDGVIVSRSI